MVFTKNGALFLSVFTKSSNFAPDEECPYMVSNKVVSNIILTNNFIIFCFISLHFICKELYKKNMTIETTKLNFNVSYGLRFG